ncbi:MAG: hypothetical protein AB7P33_01705 [Dehalococcoidia bacterium]
MTSSPTTPEPQPQSQPSVEKFPFPLQDGESVLQVSRRHWWFLWPSIALRTLFLLGPVLVIWFIFDAAGAYDGVGKQIFWVLSLLWVGYWAVIIFLIWYRYRHDVWVITNQRIVDVYKQNPFNLRVSSADLVNVQDISVSRRGILQSALNFGDIACQTSGARDVFLLTGLPDPTATQALIDKERDRERLRVRGA